MQMKEKELIQNYVTRVLVIVNQIRGMRFDLIDLEVISKVMRSLPSRFVYTFTLIEEARYVSKLTSDDLSSSLQAYEAKFDQFSEKNVYKAFVMRGGCSNNRSRFRGRGRNVKGKGRSFNGQRSGSVGRQTKSR